MKIYSELNLIEFEFWSGAKHHEFTYSELKELESQFEGTFEELSETDVNDLFWFEQEVLCEWIALDYKEYLERAEK